MNIPHRGNLGVKFPCYQSITFKVFKGIGNRNLKCTSAKPMTDICIQAKEGSLEGYTMTDAEITERDSLL